MSAHIREKLFFLIHSVSATQEFSLEFQTNDIPPFNISCTNFWSAHIRKESTLMLLHLESDQMSIVDTLEDTYMWKL